MNPDYTHLNQPSAHLNKPRELSSSVDSLNAFLENSSSVSKDNNVTVSKEGLEKLFAMFEFAVKAMRSLLAGMGVLPKFPGELEAQPQVKPGLDTKLAPDTNPQHKVAPEADTKAKVKPGLDTKLVPDMNPQHKVAPKADTKANVLPGPDTRVAADTSVQPKVEAKTDAKPQLKQGQQVKVGPDGHAQVTLTPDGKLSTRPATTSPTDAAQNNKVSSDIHVTVQVQSCHCPHTGEKTVPQPGLTPATLHKPEPQPSVKPDVPTPAILHKPEPKPLVKPDAPTPAILHKPDPKPLVKPDAPTPAILHKPDPKPSVKPDALTPATLHKPEPKPLVKPDAPTPTTVDPQPDTRPTPDLTSPAPDDLDNSSRHSRSRFDDQRAARPSLRSRF